MRLAVPLERTVARTYRQGPLAARAPRRAATSRRSPPQAAARAACARASSTPAAWKALCAELDRRPARRRAAAQGRRGVVRARLPGLEDDVVAQALRADVARPLPRPPRRCAPSAARTRCACAGSRAPSRCSPPPTPRARGVYVAALAGGRGARGARPPRRASTATATGSRAVRDALRRAAPRDALHRLGRFLRRLHDAEVVAPRPQGPEPRRVARRRGGVAFCVVDLEGARGRRGSRARGARRARDLGRLDASVAAPPVSRADRVRVLRGLLRGVRARARRRSPTSRRGSSARAAASGRRRGAPR